MAKEPTTMDLQEYLMPDQSLLATVPSPEFIPAAKPSRGSRAISLHSKANVRGFFDVNGFSTFYESGGERKVGLHFKVMKEIIDVAEQPPPVRYVDDFGVTRTHTFDWLLIKADGTKVLVAVKPADLVKSSGIAEIVELVRKQISTATADSVLLVTDKDLTPIDHFNSELIYRAQKSKSPKDDKTVAQLVKKLRGETTIGDLVGAVGVGGNGFFAVVRAIAAGRLVPINYRDIDYDLVVMRGRKKR
jgi:hypothetical protein